MVINYINGCNYIWCILNIIPKIIPILKKEDTYKEGTYKEGIALGLAQVLIGICDKLLRVRNASGKAFNISVKVFGKKCINIIVPKLVESLHIEGLKQLLQSPPKMKNY